MNETQLCTIKQIEQFLIGSAQIEFSTSGDDNDRYAHISRVLKRFDYPGRNKRERGVLLRYLQHTSGYSRAQVTRLIAQWQANRLSLTTKTSSPRHRKSLRIDYSRANPDAPAMLTPQHNMFP